MLWGITDLWLVISIGIILHSVSYTRTALIRFSWVVLREKFSFHHYSLVVTAAYSQS